MIPPARVHSARSGPTYCKRDTSPRRATVAESPSEALNLVRMPPIVSDPGGPILPAGMVADGRAPGAPELPPAGGASVLTIAPA
jgi:hypothetical protein